MKKTLFYTFIAVFAATAFITLMGLVGVFEIEEHYLQKLFYLLTAEVIAPVIALFKKTNFFDESAGGQNDSKNAKIGVVMLPKEAFPRSGDPYEYTVTIFNQDTDDERQINGSPKRANGYLTMFLDSIDEEEMIKVRLDGKSSEAWECDFFNPSVAKAEMVKV
jgi:hypothetical protein